MLDTIASKYTNLNFGYSISPDDRLNFNFYTARGNDGDLTPKLEQNDFDVISRYTDPWINYVIARGTIDPTDGPVKVSTTHNGNIDSSCINLEETVDEKFMLEITKLGKPVVENAYFIFRFNIL